MFVGDGFERVPALAAARSLLLDTFRGQQVDNINLAGVDRVMVATAAADDKVCVWGGARLLCTGVVNGEGGEGAASVISAFIRVGCLMLPPGPLLLLLLLPALLHQHI